METTSNVGNELNDATVKNDNPTFDELHSQATAVNAGPSTEADIDPAIENNEVQTPQADTEEPILENLTETLETKEEPAPEVPQVVEPVLTPDERIIDGWLKNGKTEVSMNELIQAGFDAEELDPHTNIIGIFKLSRILLVSPYKIEKNSPTQ